MSTQVTTVTELREAVLKARRVVVKIGSSSLTVDGGGLAPERIRELVDVLAGVRARGAEVVLVSSGAIAAGLEPLGMTERPASLELQQAAASVGQGLLAHHYQQEFARHGITTGQVLLTVDDVVRRSHYRNAARTFDALLDLGVVPVVNENDTVATSEIRFGDNDRLASLVAHLVHADLLVLLSDVDALYDGPPSRPGAQRIVEVRSADDLGGVEIGSVGSKVGTGGMVTKVQAARIATGAGIPVVLTAAPLAAQALAGETVGTFFHPTGRRRHLRLLWLAHASETKGTLTLDAGAVRAVVERGASLLPAGVTDVDGDFGAGDPVDLIAPDGAVVARGFVHFDAAEIPGLLGRSTADLRETLGEEYERELVHRDDLILL
ncbi:glutamate 5-kinase [Nocardioides yefusunii]|uniref:Glutamate 5-kinase n=1 Tax=Nocardioides yefusunii TaxID=2500546 RepID=A0ABW1QW56_9ACTN|nr:glutamate 5-kinase [Nocardioides yefusunii]